MFVLVALMLVMLLAALDQTIVSTALPVIAKDLHGLNKISWVSSAYLLTTAITTPIYGKISDMYGRKKIFQSAIVIFLIGSALCGASTSMNQLVAARALQGLGAGGLMSLVLAIIGDIIPPRERGKYIGYFTAVFAVSSVLGPLLGGFLTQSLSWRWVFYVNLPLGALALSAVASRLHLPKKETKQNIDYLGASLLAASATCLLLVTIWGGNTYPWGSSEVIGTGIAGVALIPLFIARELKAAQPIIPMHLFKNSIFTVSVILSFFAGIVMFATILYLPVYQQSIRHYSPTKSGLLLLPLVIGLMAASITSGRLTSKLGKYRPFPIIGTFILGIGMFLFSHIALHTSQWILSIWMIVVGVGIGTFMQVMTLAIQNAVEQKDLGVATASATFFRSLGSSFGGAIFGSILFNRFSHHLKQVLPTGQTNHALSIGSIQSGSGLAHLPASISTKVYTAFTEAFHDLFLYAIPFVVIAFIFALLLKEKPLRSKTFDKPKSLSE